MKQNYLAVIPLCAILIVTGCTTESAPKEVGGSISQITAKGDDSQEVQAESRTTLDGYSVVWNAGDAVGCMETSQPTSNHKFVLSAGAGTKDGTFVVDPESEPLTPGTWIAYYPYSSQRYIPGGPKYQLVVQTQNDATTKHVERTDWLVSDPIKIDASSMGAAFKLKHIFALVEFKVKLKEPLENTTDELLQGQCVLAAQDGNAIFPQYIYADDAGQMQFDYTANTASINRGDKPVLTATNATTSWLLTRQSSLKPLDVTVHFEVAYGAGGTLQTSATANFIPTSVLEPGKKYTLELELEFDKSNPNASILTILNKS